MKKNSTHTVLLCGAIAMVITILFYLLAFDTIFNLPMRWISLLSLLVVEIIGTIKALKMGQSILSVSDLIVSGMHLALQMVLSLIFVNAFPLLLKQYILLTLLLGAFVAIIDILLLHFDKRARECGQQYEYAANIIDTCLYKARELSLEFKSSPYEGELNDIVELFVYSNKSRLCGNEEEILMGIESLFEIIKSEETEKIEQKIKDIKDLLKIRQIQTKRQGKF